MVSGLKSQIAYKLEISTARVKLIHGTGVLKSNRSLGESSVEDGATVTVIVLPPIYEGSEVYNRVADVMKHANRKLSDDQVNEHMANMMDRKTALHDALAGR